MEDHGIFALIAFATYGGTPKVRPTPVKLGISCHTSTKDWPNIGRKFLD